MEFPKITHVGNSTYVGVRAQFAGDDSLLLPCGSEDQTQLIRLGGKYLYSLSLLVNNPRFLRQDFTMYSKLALNPLLMLPNVNPNFWVYRHAPTMSN